MKVRFCVNPTCTDIADDMAPERWFALEHPFYLGERTSWTATISEVPSGRDTAPFIAPRCVIEGCADAELGSYCHPDDTHLCEPSRGGYVSPDSDRVYEL